MALRSQKVVFCSAAIVSLSWFIWPAFNYDKGTSENIEIEVLAEPFTDGDKLVYRWSGDVVRSCGLSLRRTIVDSDGVVTNLVALTFEPLPAARLGPASYEVELQVPLRIAEGEAIYQAVEVPRCNWMQRVFPVEVPYPPVNFIVTR